MPCLLPFARWCGIGYSVPLLCPPDEPRIKMNNDRRVDDWMAVNSIEYVVKTLDGLLRSLIDVGANQQRLRHPPLPKFQSSELPGISILAYLERIAEYSKCSPSCFVIALIYIDRLLRAQDVVLTYFNVHRIVITSVLLAAKSCDDEYYNNAYYARLGGISIHEMNLLELEFIQLVNFSLFVTPNTFFAYADDFFSIKNTQEVAQEPLVDRSRPLIRPQDANAATKRYPEGVSGSRERYAAHVGDSMCVDLNDVWGSRTQLLAMEHLLGEYSATYSASPNVNAAASSHVILEQHTSQTVMNGFGSAPLVSTQSAAHYSFQWGADGAPKFIHCVTATPAVVTAIDSPCNSVTAQLSPFERAVKEDRGYMSFGKGQRWSPAVK